ICNYSHDPQHIAASRKRLPQQGRGGVEPKGGGGMGQKGNQKGSADKSRGGKGEKSCNVGMIAALAWKLLQDFRILRLLTQRQERAEGRQCSLRLRSRVGIAAACWSELACWGATLLPRQVGRRARACGPGDGTRCICSTHSDARPMAVHYVDTPCRWRLGRAPEHRHLLSRSEAASWYSTARRPSV
ncbi:hypothetical protein N9L68_08485, partial [bacterium]|nr:hypothetical protein [bacterium]